MTSAGDQVSSTEPAFPFEFVFDSVSKDFATQNSTEPFTAIRDVSLSIAAGSFTSVIGPSGCGKSTLLNMAAGLMQPTSGTVLYRGRRLTQINSDVGYITQQNNLLPWRTVERNVALALEIRKLPRRERRERVAAMLKTVGLADFARHHVSQTSGGMQKRTAIARTLIYDPSTLLMDEPFGALDAQLRLRMQAELLTMWEARRSTVIFVTHDLEEAILLGDRVVVFGKSPGNIMHTEEIPFPRPRALVQLRADPAFGEIWERLWRLLERELEGAA